MYVVGRAFSAHICTGSVLLKNFSLLQFPILVKEGSETASPAKYRPRSFSIKQSAAGMRDIK
jgi:hypothetical protein